MIRGSHWIGVCTMLALALLAAGCSSSRRGAQLQDPIVTVTVPTNMQSGVEATWKISWRGGNGPFTLGFNAGAGSAGGVVSGTAATSPTEVKLLMISEDPEHDMTYRYQAVVTDVVGRSGTVSGKYTIHPAPPAGQPTIDEVVYTEETRTLLVTVSDVLDESRLTVTVTVPQGLSVDEVTKEAAATGPFHASFVWDATNVLAGGAGQTTISVSNGTGPLDTALADITVPPYIPLADTLYAIPQVPTINISDAVRIMVVTGELSNPFLYLNGVRITVAGAADYVTSSFDAGDLDETADTTTVEPVDGVWAGLGCSSFLLAPEALTLVPDQGDGLTRFDFNLTPLDGTAATGVAGMLFSFQLSFGAAGTYALSFERAEGVNRTYYSADSEVIYYWEDSTNAHERVPNTIEVVEPAAE